MGLVNERTSTQRQIDDLFLADFPNSFENISSLLRDLGNLLDRPILSNQLISNLGSPKILNIGIFTLLIR